MKNASAQNIRDLATGIVRQLHATGFSAFWVGGCVRDYLLGRDPQDYDIATNALPADVEKIFKRTIPVGRKFGVMIVLEDGHQFQVATFRAEEDYRDGRRPEKVSFADARADAIRRDFTINGLFYDPDAKKLHDWVDGEKDLRGKIIRTIGSPEERFGEDHLRMLRAVRLAAQLGFEIERKTFKAIQSHAAKIRIISAERIRDELIKLFSPKPLPTAENQRNSSSHQTIASRGLELLRSSGLLEQVLPELVPTITCDQSPEFHPEGTVFTHIGLMLNHLPPDAHPSLPWAVLMHDIAKPLTLSRDPKSGSLHFYGHEKMGAEMTETIMGRLRFPRKQITEVADVVRHHMQFKDAFKMRKSTLRRILMRSTFPLELQLQRLDYLGSNGNMEVYDFLVKESIALEESPQIRPPLLTGDDLVALGMKPGAALGKMLEKVRDKQLQEELTTPAEACTWVKRELAAKAKTQTKARPKSEDGGR